MYWVVTGVLVAGVAVLVAIVAYSVGDDYGRREEAAVWREANKDLGHETDRLKAKLAELRTAVTRAMEDAKEE